ncbi:hypothetical protein WN55_09646 [Dufourea novaeangliae]|uniref:Uncharacterized protein n=1 Tax=Dufourea novaeangliae TaxID=178035 RepID=A0A154NYZ5_DUFNO|nr:hypothetical protein WN55_09646 [Dufourea novaeangliae]
MYSSIVNLSYGFMTLNTFKTTKYIVKHCKPNMELQRYERIEYKFNELRKFVH